LIDRIGQQVKKAAGATNPKRVNARIEPMLPPTFNFSVVVGVLNATPDSFSDGGRHLDPHSAAAHALQMVADGAGWIDVGGESTRPGSEPVPESEQIRRVAPVIRAVRAVTDVPISIDTTRAAVADAAVDVGATIVNDISAGRDDAEIFSVVARRRVSVVLMHMRGTPKTMQDQPMYGDVVAEVGGFLKQRLAAAAGAGIDAGSVWFDPGIGFGKTTEHNLQLLRRLPELVALGRPVLVGTSRKGFIGKVTGEDLAGGRRMGTAATVAWAVAHGASAVRVHDVAEMSAVVRMVRAIAESGR
jgi:dihydropteroate synthase